MSDLPPGLGDQIGSLLAGQGLSPEIQTLFNQLYGSQLLQPQAQYGYDVGLAGQSYADTIASLGIQKGALARETKGAADQYNISKEGLVLDQNELGLQRQQQALRGQSLDLTQTQEQQAADISRRSAWSGATARGATNTSGFSQGLGDINQNLANQLAQLQLSRQGLGLQGQELDISGQRLGLSNMQTDINYSLQQGSLADQLAQLGLNYNIAGQTQQNAIAQAGINAQSGLTNTALNQLNNLQAGAAAAPGIAGSAGALGNATPAPQYVQPPNPVGRG